MRAISWLVIVVVLIGTAHGDERTARIAIKEGTRLYEVGEFAEALTAFKRAYLASEDPTILFNIAETQRELGNKPEAIRLYKSYLAKVPGAANAAEVRAAIASLEAPEAPAAPPKRPVEPTEQAVDDSINLLIDGPAANDEKRTRCYALVRQSGIALVPDAEYTAVLRLSKEGNRLQIVSRANGIVRDEARPFWPMEQLCQDAASTVQSMLGRQVSAPRAASAAAPVWDDPRSTRLRENLREARKKRNRATAQIVFGSIFAIGAAGMMASGIAIMATSSSSSDNTGMSIGGGLFGGGLIGLGVPAGLMLGFGSVNLRKSRNRVSEIQAELDRVSGVTRGGSGD